MNDFLRAFVAASRSLARDRSLVWPPEADANGKITKHQRWNLTALAGMVPPPTIWLSNLGPDEKAYEALNALRQERGQKALPERPLDEEWRDLIMAVVINEIVVKKNKPMHALNTMGRSVRVLATCAAHDPSSLSGDEVQLTYNVAMRVGESGKLASNVAMTVGTIIDGLHLADQAPLAKFCAPYPDERAQAAQATIDALRRAVTHFAPVASLLR